MNLVYLDYAATTPVAFEVADVMAQHLTLEGNFANSASRSHRFGWQAEEAVESARITVAKLIGASNREIVWTSGATESNNLALKGVLEGLESGHIITSNIEHKAILDTCAYQETKGFDVTYLEPNSEGLITAEQVKWALRADTRLVSLMLVNNEIGNITDIKSISQVLSNHQALLHCDAAQGAGKLDIDVTDLNVDLMSLCAHKMYGPKGIGALYVRKAPEVKVHQQIHGGGHERGMRSGTLATHQIVGFAKAAELIIENLESEIDHNRKLRDRLWQGIKGLGVKRNSHESECSPNHLNVSFMDIDGEILLASLAQLAVSSGSACNSASIAPSYVLKALGMADELAHAGIRFSVGRYTTESDIDFAVSEIKRVLLALK
jgi:cysteine desulfurase